MRDTTGQSPILLAVDHDGNDLTDLVSSWLGPRFDWHGDRTSTCDILLPRDVKGLTLTCADGSEKELTRASLFPILYVCD
jgi:hypothetical protein